ncbi:MAG: ferrochelatase [Myxococcaceae bacterium]|nr:ferrochelatase [Myxococcaceae bacterium]
MAGRVGVVLLHRGDPESPEQVREWLTARYADPKATRSSFGGSVQGFVAGLVGRIDAGAWRAKLEAIGGASPVRRQVQQLSEAVSVALDGDRVGTAGAQFEVRSGLRYDTPSIAEAVESLRSTGVERLVGVSLYPQPCRVFTPTLVAAVEQAAGGLPVTFVDRFHAQPAYVEAVRDAVQEAVARAPESTVLFGALHVERDELGPDEPYPGALVETMEAVMAPLARPYKLGWLEEGGPGLSVLRMAERLQAAGTRSLVVASLGTTVDELSTLYALDAQLRARARAMGFEHIERAAAACASPRLAGAVAAAVQGHLAHLASLGFG